MKANEEGLTKGEKIMFSALGVILVVALGVLIVNNFSKNNLQTIVIIILSIRHLIRMR